MEWTTRFYHKEPLILRSLGHSHPTSSVCGRKIESSESSAMETSLILIRSPKSSLDWASYVDSRRSTYNDRSMTSIELTPVATVINGEHDLARVDWSRQRSKIQLNEGLDDRLLGLEDYSHIIVIAWLDRTPEELRDRPRAYPAGDDRLPLQGALALRGGARPNPLAVTVCRLVAIEAGSVTVEGLDLIEGTPVLDLKPYIAFYDARPDATLPRWAEG
jgi:tRNA-Thr(GGU) m(6)t(6)A37 methyltransferase TsaA